jgi:hypothetical protein
MNHPDTTNSPKIRPKVVLWTLLVCQLGIAVFSLGQAWTMEREASALDVREPEMRGTADRTKDRIQTETDIARLRTIALNSYDLNFEEWRDKSYRLHQFSEGLLDLSFVYAFTSAILAYAIYGLRNKTPAA